VGGDGVGFGGEGEGLGVIACGMGISWLDEEGWLVVDAMRMLI